MVITVRWYVCANTCSTYHRSCISVWYVYVDKRESETISSLYV